MLHFSQRKHILLKENDKEAFYLVASDENEINEIKDAMEKEDFSNPLIDNIEIAGLSRQATSGLANKYIPIIRKTNKKEVEGNGKIVKYNHWTETEYKCYAAKDKVGYNSILTHEEPLSSLKCAIQCLGSPEYVYITRISKNVFEPFKERIENQLEKIRDYGQNNSGNSEIHKEGEDVGETTPDIL